ncbi:glucan synthase [Deinococcus piscis]|uniref:Glucan synthase n=1 Tax=Deinococcus piscis TaxID=394230 RepID=A0ABQ3K9Y8_9DEIO|nr:SMI1/KNR4 family protein [Deinococcus piscis]GHG01723.1 glucan synthase [Deinococcus piscis]
MSEISAVWERIEVWYEAQGQTETLKPGASPEAIAQAEKDMGLTFPPELRESLLRHDGSADGGWPTGELLSLERMVDERKVWMDLLQDGTFDDNADHNEGSEALQPGWWNPAWIPLDADGGGNGAVIDLNPGPQGTVGQVIDMDHEVGPSGPEYPSLAAYLEAMLGQFSEGDEE